jgi:hypothetical protein
MRSVLQAIAANAAEAPAVDSARNASLQYFCAQKPFACGRLMTVDPIALEIFRIRLCRITEGPRGKARLPEARAADRLEAK